MGLADEDADSLAEIGLMPPLPRPQSRPTVRSPASAGSGSTRRSAAQAPPSTPHSSLEMEEEPSPAPVPHAHPLRGWTPTPQENNQLVANQSHGAVNANVRGGGAAVVEYLRRPLRRRDVDVKRLDPAFLNRARIEAFANNSDQYAIEDEAVEVEPHSTRALEQRIHQVETESMTFRPLEGEELHLAATEASEWRQFGYGDLHPADTASRTEDTALERARVRKVKKQVDRKWLQVHTDPALRPPGPLDRPKEMELYDAVYRVTMDELVHDGVLFDEHDRKSALTVAIKQWNDLAMDHRGTTGVCGSCFNEWSFP